MDARITKQRLANMLSYDWLKIVGVIALAVLFFVTFFMMIGARPTDGQKFYVYCYEGLNVGGDYSLLADDMKKKDVFGYEILDMGSESFSSSGLFGGSVFSARRSVGEGRVMFVKDVRTTDSEGKESSVLLHFINNEGTPRENFRMFLDPQMFLEECKGYLQTFFGEDLAGPLNHEKARETFLARNAKDARFRTAAKKENGIKQEEERLEKLKADYLFVNASVGEGKALEYVTYETEIKPHTIGFYLKGLNLTKLVYYTEKQEEEEVQKHEGVALCLFDNGTREGDLKYETVNFLAYLVRKYSPEAVD